MPLTVKVSKTIRCVGCRRFLLFDGRGYGGRLYRCQGCGLQVVVLPKRKRRKRK